MGKRTYDIRVRNAVARSGNPDLFPELHIPRSTALQWIREGVKEVVTHPSLNWSQEMLVEEICALRKALAAEQAKNSLVKCSLEIVGFRMQYVRVAAGDLKKRLLNAIKSATDSVSLKECLETIGLSAARYHSWVKRQVKCLLPDEPSCPRLSPTKITSKEMSVIKELVTAKDFGHFSINSLAMYAKREGRVFASVTRWYRVVRAFGLRRPRIRVYPAKPKIGIRASLPNEIWHIDVSVFRIVNGPKVYIQSAIDNASRYVLAWQVTETYGGVNTKGLLEKALSVANEKSSQNIVPNVFADSGCENINGEVKSLVQAKKIDLTVAQIDVDFSNSMIESLFRSLKHRWLFLRALKSIEEVRKAVSDYFFDHNNRIPHHTLGGAVPFEVYSGIWMIESKLNLGQSCLQAKTERIELNRIQKCGLCPT